MGVEPDRIAPKLVGEIAPHLCLVFGAYVEAGELQAGLGRCGGLPFFRRLRRHISHRIALRTFDAIPRKVGGIIKCGGGKVGTDIHNLSFGEHQDVFMIIIIIPNRIMRLIKRLKRL